jgi:DNA-directed RNA polymerase subunit RPC12/RpoP
MPLFDYKCSHCGTELIDVLLRPGDTGTPDCIKCGSLMLKNYGTLKPVAIYEENDSVDYDLSHEPIVYHTKGQLKKIAAAHGCRIRE